MATYLSPVGLAAAPVNNQLSVLATYKEELCKPYCAAKELSTQPGVTYTYGTPVLVGSTVFVPITAQILVLTPGNCCNATPITFTERFEVAFQGQTALPASVNITSTGRIQTPTCIDSKGCAHGYVINDSLTIALVAA